MKVIYTAEFVKNIPELLKRFPPKHSKVLGHHSTITFRPKDLAGIEIGKESVLKILGYACDEKCDALLVENVKSENKYPHITLSCTENVAPTYAKELLDRAIQNKTIEYFTEPYFVEVVEGYFDGVGDIIKL